MDVRVTLDLRPQFLDDDIPVFVDVSQEKGALLFTDEGVLPANRPLFRQLDQWRSHYRGLAGPYREIKLQSAQIGGGIQSQKEACAQSAEGLQQQFQTWLQAASFQPISNGLREHLHHGDEIRILLRTDRVELRQLPWQCWDLLNSYSKAEIVLSNPTAKQSSTDPPAHKDEHSQVEILAVLGSRDRIDIETDLNALQAFSSDANIYYLPQPSEEALFNKLWEKPWDIFFFAGHSRTEGKQGYICLNETEELPIARLSEALKTAIQKGLSIAIFNSCDGLGLAQDLEKLHIPNLIVMREPVPDAIAQLFLKNLLSAYSQDMPLHRAVRDARKKLTVKEREYPCASSLPILCQNPTTPSPTWSQIRTGSRTGGRIRIDRFEDAIKEASIAANSANQLVRKIGIFRRIATISLACIVVSTLAFGLRFTPLMNASELHAYDRLMQMRPRNESSDPRLLIIGIDGEDRDYQTELGMTFENSNTLSNDGLNLLIEKVERELNPSTIGLGVYMSGKISEKYASLIDKFKNNPKLFTMCKVPAPQANDEDGTSPTEAASRERLGFSDFSVDDDGVVRRHLLSIRNDSTLSSCTPTTDFSLLAAENYLSHLGYFAGVRKDKNGKDEIYFRNESSSQLAHLPRLPEQSPAASQYPFSDIGGYQILLNYRATDTVEDIAEMVPLREFLDTQIDPEKLARWQQRIVLIGNTGAVRDSHWTPYHRGQNRNQIGTYGVYLHAHMISQIISLVLDDRPLMKGLSLLKNYLWMLIWSVAAGMILLIVRGNVMLMIADVILFSALFLMSYILFCQSVWMPLVPGFLSVFATQLAGLWLIGWQSNRDRLKRFSES
jgi:CHASE2 domain-containing sensor protein